MCGKESRVKKKGVCVWGGMLCWACVVLLGECWNGTNGRCVFTVPRPFKLLLEMRERGVLKNWTEQFEGNGVWLCV